ncbi:hypothetical protein H5398_03285 [Tessaracoccus sp. MC1679]|uniref:hypothetical protein n=1 Tax=Tessaracoccus sp. MC1679 TaxID=2760313 RepID=UPI0015FF9923|nr:hypothetical protein [Tessaracoccus sp. MC1679]MBB1515003.1 hypothetical protein [Tessaracoccus sp. MC1679]
MPEPEGMTAEDLRACADHLRDVLRLLDDGEVEVSSRERAYIAGALRAVELMHENLGQAFSVAALARDGRI